MGYKKSSVWTKKGNAMVRVSFDTKRASASLLLKPKKTPTIYQISATQYIKLPINMDIQFSFKMSGKKNS